MDEETPAWNPERMNQWTLDRLRALTVAASEKALLSGPLCPHRFPPRGLVDSGWRKLPILDKDAVRNNFAALRADDAEGRGPVACRRRIDGHGPAVPPGPRREQGDFRPVLAGLVGMPELADRKTQAVVSGFAQGKWQYQWKTRVLALSSFHVGRTNCRFFFDLIQRYRPAFLRGYPSSLYLFNTHFLEEAGLS